MDELQAFATLKQREHAALNQISNPAVRKEIANALGIRLDEKPAAGQPAIQPAIWRGGKRVDDNAGNG